SLEEKTEILRSAQDDRAGLTLEKCRFVQREEPGLRGRLRLRDGDRRRGYRLGTVVEVEVRAPSGDADGGTHGEDGDLDQDMQPDRKGADRRCGPLEGDSRQEQRAAKEEPEEEEPQGARPASRKDPAGPPVGAPGADRGAVPARGAREILQQRQDRIEN